MTDIEIRTFIDAHEWTFAKTMPQIPHWYTLKRKAKSEEDFAAFVQEMRFRGFARQFGSKSFTYLDLDGWTYWTMGAPIEETILIQQVMPLPEAQDYIVCIRQKEQQERKNRAERWSAEAQQFCVDYWSGVLDEIRPSGILEPDVKPLRKEDMRFKVGWPDFFLKAYFSRRAPKGGVWLDCRGDAGIANYETLKAHQSEIEKTFGEPLHWDVDEDRESRSVSCRITGFDANDKSDGPRQYKLLADRIMRLYHAVRPFVDPLCEKGDAD